MGFGFMVLGSGVRLSFVEIGLVFNWCLRSVLSLAPVSLCAGAFVFLPVLFLVFLAAVEGNPASAAF